MTESIETDLLAELVQQKHDVLVELRELSRRQAEIIAGGDISKLLSVLAAKQALLSRLQQLEPRLEPFRQQDPEARIWRSEADRGQCRQVAERCEAMLKEIILFEKRGEADLITRRDAAAVKLQGTHSASEARHAYTQLGGAGSVGLDLTSES